MKITRKQLRQLIEQVMKEPTPKETIAYNVLLATMKKMFGENSVSSYNENRLKKIKIPGKNVLFFIMLDPKKHPVKEVKRNLDRNFMDELKKQDFQPNIQDQGNSMPEAIDKKSVEYSFPYEGKTRDVEGNVLKDSDVVIQVAYEYKK